MANIPAVSEGEFSCHALVTRDHLRARKLLANKGRDEPEIDIDQEAVERLSGVRIEDMSTKQLVSELRERLKSMGHESLVRYIGERHRLLAFLKMPAQDIFLERRVLFNVKPGLSGDLSGLWGNAQGISGRVNRGTFGCVTGLTGRLDNVFGELSYVWGHVHERLSGCLTGKFGFLTGKWGYVSDVLGDVSGMTGDLTCIVGNVTDQSGNARYFRARPREVASSGFRVVERFVTESSLRREIDEAIDELSPYRVVHVCVPADESKVVRINSGMHALQIAVLERMRRTDEPVAVMATPKNPR